MPDIAFLVERPVYNEEGLYGFSSQATEVVLLILGNDGEVGCRLIYPGSSSHAEQLAG